MKPTKEELLKQLADLTELAKSKGLLKVDPKTRLPGTFVDKSDKVEKQGSIQAGISAAGAAGGVPHTTPAGSTLGAINAMGSAFGKSGNLDKHASREMASKLRSIYGKSSSKESSISANNNPDPSLGKSGTQPVSEGTSPDMIKKEPLSKPVPKGVNADKYDRCVEDVKRKGGAKNAYAVCASSLKKGDEVDKALSASIKGERTDLNKCDKLKDIVGSLKKGYFLP